MALNLTEIQAVSNDYCEKKSTDIYFSDSILIWMLSSGKIGSMYGLEDNFVQPKDLVDGGQYIRELLEYQAANSGAYGATTSINTEKKTTFNAARFRWAGYYAANTIDLDDQVQVSGDAALIELVQGKIDNIQKTIRDAMGTAIYAQASSSKDFLGLGDLFETTGSTAYATIASDDMSSWAANASAASAAISFKLMQQLRQSASVGQNAEGKPNLYITTEALRDGFERVLQVQARYSDVNLVNAGFENVLFGGVPVCADDKQTAGYVDGLNLRYMKLRAHPNWAYTKPVWEHDKDMPDKLTANVRFIGQLTTNHRSAHGRYTSVSEP